MAPTQSLRAELRALPRGFWVLCAGMFINRFGTFVYPFLAIVLFRRGFSYGEIGFAIGASGVGSAAASLIGGWFTDRFGRRNTIVLGTLAQAFFTLLIDWAHSLPELIALVAFSGFFGGFFNPAGSALIADLVPENARLRAFSAYRLAINAGFACGTATGGFLVNYSSFWLFAGDALTTALFGLVAWALLPHGLRHHREQARWSQAFAIMRRDRRLWLFVAAQFTFSLVFCQVASTYPLDVTRRPLELDLAGLHLTIEALYGVLMTWNGILICGCELTLTRFTQRFASRHIVGLGCVLTGLGFLFNTLPGGVFPLFLGISVFSFGEMLAMPTSSTWFARLAPPELRGRYMGVLGLTWALATLLAPQFGLYLYAFHPALLWGACLLLSILAAFLFARAEKG